MGTKVTEYTCRDCPEYTYTRMNLGKLVSPLPRPVNLWATEVVAVQCDKYGVA